MSQNNNKPKKSKIPYIFVAFFATFIIADICFIYIANKTWRGTVTEDSYEKGRKYNKILLNNQKQKDLGWSGKINYKAISTKKSLIIFDLKDQNNKIIKNAKIKLKLVRPTQTGYDFDEELIFNLNKNNYQKTINFPLIGLWKVEVQAFVKDEVFQYVKRIVID